MAEIREGGCQCGGVRYRVEGDPVVVVACHCKECQRQSGSAFGMGVIVQKEQFALLRGTLKQFTRSADSGGQVVCSFCPDCGIRIIHEPSRMAGMVNVRAGTFDDTSWIAPRAQAWTSSKQPWLQLGEGLMSFERQP
jgi:hypothetical protein